MRKSWTTAIILLAVLSAASSAAAQDSRCFPPQPPGHAIIKGKVTAEDTSTPVTSSMVAIGVGASSSVIGGAGFTQADGSYQIQVPAPATFVVVAFPVDTVHASAFWDGAVTEADATRIMVTDGETRDHVDFSVIVGGTIDGTVTSENGGDPISNVRVLATLIGDLPSSASTVTDSMGHYHLAGLAFADYEVQFTPHDSSDNFLSEVYNNEFSTSGDPVTVTMPGVTGIDAALGQGGRIEGTITGPSNQPLVAVNVRALANGTAVIGQALTTQPYQLGRASTDLDGNYSIVVPSATYKVLAIASSGLMSEFFNNKFTQATADDVVVTAPNATTGKDIQLDNSGKITGKVTDSMTHQPIFGAIVAATEPNGTVGASGAVVFTDNQGNYELNTNLHTGDYSIGFFATNHESEYYNNKATPLAADPVHVTAPGTTPNIDAALNPCTPGQSTTTTSTTSTSIKNTTSTTSATSTTGTTSSSTTTSTVPPSATCGDPAPPHPAITASDALAVLKKAVGSDIVCPQCECDVNNSGGMTAADALAILKKAVGQPVPLNCPPCDQ